MRIAPPWDPWVAVRQWRAPQRWHAGPEWAPGGVRCTRSLHGVAGESVGAALRESEDRYRAMAENASDLVAEVDVDGRFLFVSPNCHAILGIPAEQIVGRKLADLTIDADERDALLEGYERDALSTPC